MNNGIQQFDFGQRTYIALKFKTGQLVKKPWGESVRYTLVNGKSAFFPVEVNESIKSLNLGPREAFSITRRRENDLVVWDVERAEPQKETGPTLTPPSEVPGQPHAIESNAVLTAIAPEPIRKPMAVATPVAALNTEQSRHIMKQLVAAIEVTAAAEKYALNALGRKVEFSHEDIRALAISGFIEASRSAA